MLGVWRQMAKEFGADMSVATNSKVHLAGEGWSATLPLTPRYEINEKIARRIVSKIAHRVQSQ